MSEDKELIEHMRARVAKCRWLATMINHPEGRLSLLQMAADGEADIKKLDARAARSTAEILGSYRSARPLRSLFAD